MSDGGVFSQEILRLVVLKVSQRMGIHSVEEDALETLVLALEKIIKDIGSRARDSALTNGRATSDINDISRAVRLVSGIKVKSLLKKVELPEWEISFVNGVPEYPVEVGDDGYNTRMTREDGVPEFAPSFFPPLPEEHSYARTDLVPGSVATSNLTTASDKNAGHRISQSLAKVSGINTTLLANGLKRKRFPI